MICGDISNQDVFNELVKEYKENDCEAFNKEVDFEIKR